MARTNGKSLLSTRLYPHGTPDPSPQVHIHTYSSLPHTGCPSPPSRPNGVSLFSPEMDSGAPSHFPSVELTASLPRALSGPFQGSPLAQTPRTQQLGRASGWVGSTAPAFGQHTQLPAGSPGRKVDENSDPREGGGVRV